MYQINSKKTILTADVHPERIQLTDRIAFVGTLLIISVLSDTLELKAVTDPYELGSIVILLRSICISAGLNTTAVCLTQYSFQAIYKITLDSINMQIVSMFITLTTFALRYAVGWPILVFNVKTIDPALFDIDNDAKILFFLVYAVPLYLTLFVVYPFECAYLYRKVIAARELQNVKPAMTTKRR
jgi:hypothetical protein